MTIEDAAELRLNQTHVLRLEARPKDLSGENEISIRDLVRNSLRMRPDRIIVGEVRGPEALDMLQAMNTGHDGSLSTVHCNGPRDALARIETMVLMAGFDLPVRAIREQVASALECIVHLERLEDGSRRVTSITEVQRMESDVITLQELFKFQIDEVTPDGTIVGGLRATGLRPTFVQKFEKRGISLPWGCSSRTSRSAARRSERSASDASVTSRRDRRSRTPPHRPLAGATAPPAAAVDQGGGAGVPDRTFALSLPDSRALRPRDIQVTENGGPVRRPSSRAREQSRPRGRSGWHSSWTRVGACTASRSRPRWPPRSRSPPSAIRTRRWG